MRGETGRETSPVNTLLLKQEGLQLAEPSFRDLQVESFANNFLSRDVEGRFRKAGRENAGGHKRTT